MSNCDPNPYDVSNPDEVKRLHRELLSYMKISVDDGTDRTGRQYALDALKKLVDLESEQKLAQDNPLVAITLWFRDGSALRQVFSNPVPQVKAMAALGEIVAKLGGELNIQIELAVDDERFAALANRWHDDTDLLSSPSRRTNNDAYLEIISMGKQVIPLILKDLKERGGDWYRALRILGRENPVPAEDQGYVEKMNAAWFQWGHVRGYINVDC